MRITKPKFWDKKIGFQSILLFPISLIFIILSVLKKKISIPQKFKISVICIGNIYVGGTGKTPTSLIIARELERKGIKTVILRKYYKNHFDEYNLIKNHFENLILKKNRAIALREAEKSGFEIAILDDGFQDYTIKKNLNIICFNQSQLIGNGLILPSGPLRESLSALKRANIVIINGSKDERFEEKILKINKKLQIYYSSYKPVNIDEFRNKKLIAIAGIGNPENFFNLIERNNCKIERKLIFPDHHNFSKNEIENIIDEALKNDCHIVMTEKDYFKIKHFNLKNINYLKILIEIKEIEKLINNINEIRI